MRRKNKYVKIKKERRIKMKMMIDRIETNYLIIELEDGTFLELPKKIIPEAKEGDVLKIEIDAKETKKRKEKIKNLMQKAFED